MVAQLTGVVPQVGERYAFEAYVRDVPGESRPSGHYVELVSKDDQNTSIEELETHGPAIDDTWRRTSTFLPITKPGATPLVAQLGVQPTAGASTCIVVDDARVYRVP